MVPVGESEDVPWAIQDRHDLPDIKSYLAKTDMKAVLLSPNSEQ